MLFVIDSNEYIFAFGLFTKPSCRALLKGILDGFPSHNIRITRVIAEEVKRNLTPEEFKEFIEFITSLTTIDEDISVPFEIGLRYESMEFKPADAFIAAFTEWTGADTLVTENRHFLTQHTNLPFKVLNAESCLKLLGK